ncbi:MAG: hypothetical protein K1X57_21250 [Gemmataceae bacterium]|nr:hypothetical protein [Gemmataceae bacterium]
MEHLLFHLIVEGIQALDRKLQKPLHRAVPELGRLKANPRDYLRQAPVVIAPRKRQFLSVVIGLIAGFVVVAVMGYFYAKARKPAPLDAVRIAGVVFSFVTVAFVARSFALYALRGGTMTLRLEGVEMSHDEASLFLPWDLFFASGALFEADQKNVVLPINPSVPVAVTKDNEERSVQAVLPGELGESPFVDCDEGQLSMKDLYEVRVAELGALVHELGQRLGAEQAPDGAASLAPLPPVAVAEEKGWVRIQLTQLPLPPICGGCGSPTGEMLDLPVMANRRSMTLGIPFCPVCRARRRRSMNIATFIGLAVGFLAGAAIGATVMGNRADGLRTIVALALGGIIGLPAGLIARFIVRDNATPLKARDYKPERGTVRVKFRNPQQSALLMAAIGLPVKLEAGVGAGREGDW